MNVNYNLLWVDDDPDYVKATIEILKKTVRNNNMEPHIQVYNSFDELKSTELDSFDIDIFNQYDQIVIDYALSGATGDEIITCLRDKNIYTDVVFYSSDYEKMVNSMKQKSHLDGVFFAEREDLTSVVDIVVKKNIKREYNIANIRGLIMDSTSEFDYICKIVSMELFEKLDPSKQTEIVKKAEGYVQNAKAKSKSNFSSVLSKKDKALLKNAMESVYYVMDNKDRYSILSSIVREFAGEEIFNDDFSEQYYTDLIKPRNDLAHNKLYYGHCKKKLYVAKKKEKLECDQKCDECKSKYDIEKCEKIRAVIFDYYNKLVDLNNSVDTY